MMKVSRFGGTVECKTIEDLDSVLNTRYGTGVNEFWLSGEEDTPCLAVLVNNCYANLTYFPEDGHPGLQSIGTDTDLKFGEWSIFYTNTPTEEMEVLNDFIIPLALAKTAAIEFFRSFSIPTF